MKRIFSLILLAIEVATHAQNALPVVNILRTGRLDTREAITPIPGQFTITKDQNVRLSVRIEFSGTATTNLDYTAGYLRSYPTNLLLLDATAASAVININVRDDLHAEGNETVTVTIQPDASYTIGPFASATLTIADNDDPNAPNIPPTASLGAPPPYINAGTNLNLYLTANDLDGDLVSVELFDGTNKIQQLTNYISGTLSKFVWSNIPPGLHELYVRATDNDGAITNTPAVAVLAGDLIAAAAAGTYWGGTDISPDREVSFRSTGGANTVLFEFPIPAWATEADAFLSLFFTSAGERLDVPIEVFLYSGDGTLTPDDHNSPLTYVSSIQTNSASTPFQIDLSPWIGAFAGKFMGVQLRIDPISVLFSTYPQVLYYFSAPVLGVFGRDSYPPPLHIQFPTIPQNGVVTTTNLLSFDILSLQPAASLSWTVDIDETTAATGKTDFSEPGTNHVTLDTPAITLGAHTITVSISNDSSGITKSERRWFFAIAPEGPPQRFFGSSGQSKSFYLVDIAGRAEVWGANESGQLGVGFRSPSTVPIPQSVTLPPPPGRKWRQIASDTSYAIAVADDYSLWGWGSQTSGQFGLATNILNLSPIRLPLNFYARSIAAGTTKTYVLDIFGRLWILRGSSSLTYSAGWEQISAAQSRAYGIHSGEIIDITLGRNYPPPNGETWAYVSAGEFHALALTRSGQMYGWGVNGGRLPFNGDTNAPKKVLIPGISSWNKVAAGTFVSLAVDDLGRLFAWGPGKTGSRQPIPNVPTLVDVPADVTGWLDIAVCDTLSMALAKDGRVFTWGQSPPNSGFPELLSLPNVLDPHESRNAIAFYGLASPNVFSPASMNVAAAPGTVLSLETSPDLRNWTPAMTFTNLAGLQTIQISNTPNASIFYRLGSP